MNEKDDNDLMNFGRWYEAAKSLCVISVAVHWYEAAVHLKKSVAVHWFSKLSFTQRNNDERVISVKKTNENDYDDDDDDDNDRGYKWRILVVPGIDSGQNKDYQRAQISRSCAVPTSTRW